MQKQINKRICYGFNKRHDGEWIRNNDAANVLMIFNQYLQGKSIRDIIKLLKEMGIPSSTGKTEWSPRAIEKVLANESYVDRLISAEMFNQSKKERERRSNTQITELGTVRKSVRYHSKNMFSGLLFCEECGGTYRRITKHNGSVVWRCVNRVEKRNIVCKKSPSVPEETLNLLMIETLGERYSEEDIRQKISEIKVCYNGSLEVENYENLNLTM